MSNALALIAKQTGALSFTPDEYKGWMYRFKVAGSSGNEYTVSMRVSDKVWGCSCPGWSTHRNCKHIRPMLPVLTAAVPGSKQADPPQKKIGR